MTATPDFRHLPHRVFSFGAGLRLNPLPQNDYAWPTRVDIRSAKEEGLETLLMLNLDQLFGGYGMRPFSKNLDAWAGADIEADDLAGCRHVFEVKYGSPVKNVVDQALSYALGVLAQDKHSHFGENLHHKTEEILTIACRIAGFWAHDRIDKAKRDHSLAHMDRLRKLLNDTLSLPTAPNSLDAANIEALAMDHLNRFASLTQSPIDRPNRLEFHIVVPGTSTGAEALKREDRGAIARLRYRNHQASVWEVAIELDRATCTGRLYWREFWILPQNPAKTKNLELAPPNIRITEFLCRMIAAEPSLNALANIRWNLDRPNKALAFMNHGYVMLILNLSSTTLTIEVECQISKHEKQSDKWNRREDPRMACPANWINRLVSRCDESPPKAALVRGRREWTGCLTGTKLLANTMLTPQTARITIPISGVDIDDLAKGAALAVCDFFEHFDVSLVYLK